MRVVVQQVLNEKNIFRHIFIYNIKCKIQVISKLLLVLDIMTRHARCLAVMLKHEYM